MIDMYSRFDPDKLVLRDHLALDRTFLANERTLLSYLRAGIFLLASAVTFVKLFSDNIPVIIMSYALGALGFAVSIFGAIKFRSMRRRIQTAYKKLS